jgi:hypothetical protein
LFTVLLFPFYEDHTVGDNSSAASSSLVCPYLALHGFLHPVHVPSSSGGESTSFHRHSTSLEGHATPDLSNSQAFQAAESRNHESEHRYLSSLPVSGVPDYSTSPFGIGVSRYDGSSQRSRSYAHHPPLIHRYAQCINLILNKFASCGGGRKAYVRVVKWALLGLGVHCSDGWVRFMDESPQYEGHCVL